MTREIKFKGKSKRDGRWWFGNLCVKDTKGNTQIYDPEYGGCFEIDPDTVGQFIGLHDRNGKEIYEGDIIRSFDSQGEPINHVIEYDNNDAQFIVVLAGYTKYDFGCSGITQKWINEFKKEVIGNIHDNPELLKQK